MLGESPLLFRDITNPLHQWMHSRRHANPAHDSFIFERITFLRSEYRQSVHWPFYHLLFSLSQAPPLYPSIRLDLAARVGHRLTMALISSNIELKDDTIISVLGASGDLAKKKTVRAHPGRDQKKTNLFSVPGTLRPCM